MTGSRRSGSESTWPLSGLVTPSRSTVARNWIRGRISLTPGSSASGRSSASGTFLSSIEKSAMRHWA